MRLRPLEKDTQSVDLIAGSIYSLIKKLKPNEDFMIHTKTSVMGVRGTKYLADYSASKTYVCVCEGVVEAKNIHGVARVQAGEDAELYPDKAPIKTSSPNMTLMTEAVFKEMGG